MFNKDEIDSICSQYDINCIDIGELIETTQNDNDRRYNYKINDQYFLKINNAKVINEKFLSDIDKLTRNYRSIDVYCPILFRTKENKFSHKTKKDDVNFTCYIEEKSPYPVNDNLGPLDYDFKKSMLGHVGSLAAKYTNIDLSETNSMWSLIELCPTDELVDEKQENMDMLTKCLRDHNYLELANKLIGLNTKSREKIKSYLDILPRCVYQGDLNNSNILSDENNNFKGLIDFNLSGTDVNINCFLNESMYFLEEEDFEELTAMEIFNKMKSVQNDLLSSITANYKLNKDELEILDDYNRIIYSSFFPNALTWTHLISNGKHVKKVLELINHICEY